MRINQYLSAAGFCSRREADKLIQEGRVKINGRIARLGDEVEPTFSVLVDGKKVARTNKKHYLAFHKPPGVVCTTDESVRGNIVQYIGFPSRIFPIGRLDKDSEGLILMTSDGDVVNRVLRAEHGHQKEYEVTLKRAIRDDQIARLVEGVEIFNPVKGERVIAKAHSCERIGPKELRIVLTQGLNRQIRRMCEAVGHDVKVLRRVRIMHIKLGKLPLGHYRELSKEEVKGLFR
ncbi:MAG: pseudouridine synthase [Bacillota bacterium]|nr:pseudouridine synthase [Bacillota bacterium]